MESFVKEEWVIKVNGELEQMENGSTTEMEQFWKKSIHRLPASIKDLNKKAYMPQVVSIGPYHHGEKHLRPMEEHKHRALLHFLKRSNNPLEVYIESFAPVVQDLMDSYDSLDPAWQQNTDAFLQLMILDGCFMLEIFRSGVAGPSLAMEYPYNDPIFSDHAKLYIMQNIKRDVLLLENQLPMLVLHRLLAVQNHDQFQREEEFIYNLILKFYRSTNYAAVSSMGKCLHVLDLYRKSLLLEGHRKKYQPPLLKPNSTTVHEGNDEIIISATELAGIRLMKAKTGSLKDISFRGGVLRLPFVIVDNTTESMFLNLIAFERFHVGAGNDVTSYVTPLFHIKR